jgi:hypothetical protein
LNQVPFSKKKEKRNTTRGRRRLKKEKDKLSSNKELKPLRRRELKSKKKRREDMCVKTMKDRWKPTNTTYLSVWKKNKIIWAECRRRKNIK